MGILLDSSGTPSGGQGRGGSAPPADVIKDGSDATFMADVIEASQKVPVIVDFWAPWCGPCRQLGPLLEKLVRQAGGLVKLIKINIDENPKIAGQLRVQSIPAVYAFHRGRPVDGFLGAQPESQVKAFVDHLLGGAKSPIDQALAQATELLGAGDAEQARAIFTAILGEEPEHARATAGLLRATVAAGDLEEARRIAKGLTPALQNNIDVASALAAIELAETAKPGGIDQSAFRERLAKDANDHPARFELATALYGAGETEAAIGELLELVRRARAWDDGAARKQLVKIFDALGPSHPAAVEGRRRLSTILFA